MSYRFRTGVNGELVLQVQGESSGYSPSDGRKLPPEWRDATVADIPVSAPFKGATSGYLSNLLVTREGANYWPVG